ncbi:hypothetical protein ACJBYS_08705, partial [Streptococcus suis]
ALKQPFFSKNSKKDKHQNDVCLQSETNVKPFVFYLKTEKVWKLSGNFAIIYKRIFGGIL